MKFFVFLLIALFNENLDIPIVHSTLRIPVALVASSAIFSFNYESSAKCGMKKREHEELEGKIVGGQISEPGEYPWQISLQLPHFYGPSHFCGGSLIDPSWIVTAAHCVEGLSPGHIVAVGGEHNLYFNDTNEQTAKIKEITVHEKWHHEQGNDIALLKLEKPFILGNFLNLICLPNDYEETVGNVTVTGWGSTIEDGPIAEDLMEVDVIVLSDNLCRSQYSLSQIQDSMICAGMDAGGKDSCQGDSGGPLISKNITTGFYYLAGIVSWGEGCGEAGKAGVYTQVSYFREWIRHRTGL